MADFRECEGIWTMYRVLTCLGFEHDLRLVLLAALLCLSSSIAAVVLLERAGQVKTVARVIWIVIGGAAGGFGIWATHFVAMLAYDPGVVIGYDTYLTLASLAIAVLATTGSIAVGAFMVDRYGRGLAGVLFGFGISSMHFIGISAIRFPGTLVWHHDLMVAAIVIAVAVSIPAFILAAGGRRMVGKVVVPAGFLTIAIVGMHFTAMGALDVVAGPGASDVSMLLSPRVMVVTITVVAFSLIMCGSTAAIFAIKAERAVKSSEKTFRFLVQSVTDFAIYMLTPEGVVANWNAGAQRAKGYTADEIVGRHFSEFYIPEERAAGLPAKGLETALREGKFEAEGWRLRKDGSRLWAHVVIDPIYDDQGGHIGFAKITRDRTEQMQASVKLKEASDNLSLALSHMANGIALYDANEVLVLHNDRLREIFGFPSDLVLRGRTFRELCAMRARLGIEPVDDVEAFYHEQRKLVTAPEGGDYTRTISNDRIVRTIYRPAGDGSWVTTVEDITEGVRSQAQIVHLARHDALTGLPNRRRFVEELDAALTSVESMERVAVIAVDLDNFKEVNDSFGHAAGDAVLCTIASRMQEDLHEGELVGRLGGDEFVALKTFGTDAELADFIERLAGALTRRIELDHLEMVPGGSIGVAVYPQDAVDRDKLLGNADMAMYRSKASVAEKISFYEASMDEAARERRAIARDIWKALDEGQFFLTYQVQQALKTDEVTGYEVLLRWLHPLRGLVPPSVFIPIAEECGAIGTIGDWVLEQACTEAAQWPIAHKIAVNLSPLQLANIVLVDKVRATLMKTGLPPARLELEVTESAIIGDKNKALHILRQIKAMGVTVAIDDFGTGYSSLETLRSFPFDKIKLDRSFVHELGNRQSQAFVRAMVALGKSLEVSVLAEGVETDEQKRLLIAEGCDQVQGFLLGRPATPHQLGLAGPVPKIA
jgi:diguanylate cyclase (GGDEF)-like protein/PAS domain S-box-containing protein